MKGKSQEVILVRHGETIWNSDRRVQGVSDLDLSVEGLKQAESLALYLRNRSFSVIYTSPLKRALSTARIINQYHGVPLHIDPRLMEMDQGCFEGLSYDELMLCEKEFLRKWLADPSSIRIPGGETFDEVQKRAWKVMELIIDRGENALVVSHNFTIATILCYIEKIPLSQFRRVSVEVASITTVLFEDGRGTITSFNDRSHLEGRPNRF
ncbi:MAG: histidine phosphatase family protein [Syntrophales bacterium]|nr:histidine phosphatase family protein [Syntrophales bacterium]